jgi:ferritin-like metal-binding protein YciE
MGLFTSKRLDSFDDLFVDQLQDLYDAEQRLIKALPNMVDAANNSSLKIAFQQHLRQTENHLTRLEQVFGKMGECAEGKTCQAMKGLVKEAEEVIGAQGDPEVKDAALIAAAQRVEHYEIAGYGCARTFADCLGRHDVACLLQQTLDEEEAADMDLTELAEQQINAEAAMGAR